jgi:hypothetical protein
VSTLPQRSPNSWLLRTPCATVHNRLSHASKVPVTTAAIASRTKCKGQITMKSTGGKCGLEPLLPLVATWFGCENGASNSESHTLVRLVDAAGTGNPAFSSAGTKVPYLAGVLRLVQEWSRDRAQAETCWRWVC